MGGSTSNLNTCQRAELSDHFLARFVRVEKAHVCVHKYMELNALNVYVVLSPIK